MNNSKRVRQRAVAPKDAKRQRTLLTVEQKHEVYAFLRESG